MAIAIAVGLWLARDGAGASVVAVALVASLALGAAVAFRRLPPRVASVLALVALALAGAARGGAYRERLDRGGAFLRRDGTWVRLQARVAEPPADAGEAPAVVVAIEAADPPLPRGGRLRLRCPPGTRVEWSDQVDGLAWIAPLDPPRNPGGFDGAAFARANALLASGRLVWCRVAPARGWAAWPRATFGRWRAPIERRLATRLDANARAIVWPLVLGDRSDLPLALSAELRVAGLVHLIALSGLHVSWLARLAATFAAALGFGLRGRALAGAACALVYCGIAGPIPSLARAALSELIGACARATSRRLDPLQALSLSAAMLLALYPGWAFDLGFQLSCVATLGLVTVGSWTPVAPRAVRGVAGALVSTLGAQLVSLPLVLASFHLLPWVAPLANLLAVPVAGWLLSAAWLALLADLAVPGLGHWWFGACNVLSAAFAGIVERAACVPGAARAAGHDGAVLAVAAAGAVLLAMAGARRRPPAAEPRSEPVSIPALLGATLCGAAIVLSAWGVEMRPPARRIWLVALDVGQGDAIAIAFPDGWWLVDAGARAPRYDAGDQVVLPFLRWAGVGRLDGLVITHDDSDHCGGVPAVRRGLPVRRVFVPAPLPGQPPPLARFHGAAARAGATLHADPPLVVMWPPSAAMPFVPASGITADNAGGLVLACGAGATSALLTADVDSTVEARLPVTGPIGVLKVGHHGSATSSGATFLARARPRIAIISCGRRNRFGHPDPGAVARLVACGAAIERTDVSGARWFELSAQGVTRLEWTRGGPAPAPAPRTPECAGSATTPRRP